MTNDAIISRYRPATEAQKAADAKRAEMLRIAAEVADFADSINASKA